VYKPNHQHQSAGAQTQKTNRPHNKGVLSCGLREQPVGTGPAGHSSLRPKTRGLLQNPNIDQRNETVV
jgi:hypothetical protein